MKKGVYYFMLVALLMCSSCNTQESSSLDSEKESSEEVISSSTHEESSSEEEISSTTSETSSISSETSSSSEEKLEKYFVKEYDYINLYEGKDELVKMQDDKNKPRIEIDKESYLTSEKIIVTGYNLTSSKDWVGVFPKDGQPQGMNSLNWSYFEDGKATLRVNTFENEKEYKVYLLKNDGYEILDYKSYSIYSDSSVQYSVDNPKFIYDEENKEFLIALTPSTNKELNYEIYWAKDGKRLENYSYIKTFKKASDGRFTYSCGKGLYMPEQANQIEVYIVNGKGNSIFADVNDAGKLPYSEYKYSFNVMSDLHLASNLPLRSQNLMSALNNVYSKNRDSKALILVGDQVNDGASASYEILNSIIDVYEKASNTKVYYALGNHEYIYVDNFNKQVELFTKYTKMEGINYSFEMEGSTCIVMGSDSGLGEGTISKENIKWLEQTIDNANKDYPIYVFIHQPLIDTTAGSYKNQNWYGMVDAASDLKEIFAKYDNLFVFTGHTHWELESNNTIYDIEDGPTYINDAAVGYLWNDDDAGEPGSEGLFVDVYEDYLLIKGMDFNTSKWLPYAMYVIPLK